MATITTRQNANNLLLSYLLKGVTTLALSSENTAINRIHNKKVINSYNDSYTSVKSLCRLSKLSFRYINLYIINYTFLALAKLFCLVGRNREYNSQFIGKYLLLDLMLVVNLPDNFDKQTLRGI